MTSKYITPTDYKNYFGEDLASILPIKPDIFIKQVEDEVASTLEDRCFKRIDWEYGQFNDYQKGCYKMALLHQCHYKIKNGDIGNDSGYDPQTGKIVSIGDLKSLELSRQTIKYLRLCGLWNRNINARLGGGGWIPFRGSND